MKFTHNWLLEHLDTSASAEQIAEKLTDLGLEVDDFRNLGDIYKPFVVAEIVEAVQHPNADKLRVCKVNNGSEILQIVCGAPNARAGIKVCLAPVGANIPNGNFHIKKSKIRDVESNGMLCSAEELNLGGESDGIMELSSEAKVGSTYAGYAGLNDSVYEIAITPNRADCLGVRGVARDLAAVGLGKLKDWKIENPKTETKSPVSVKSDSYYIGRYFENIKNGISDDYAAGKLKAIGQTPISTLVDITNYITFDLGRPLHVYDADKLKGNIHVREAKAGEKINALNNKTYEMQGGELVVADDNGIIALAGIIGNVETSVTNATKNIFLEVAYFEPAKVMQAGRRHMIDSDARYRFERGLDAEAMQSGAEFASWMINSKCGGKASEFVISGTKPEIKREIEFDFSYIKQHGGVDIAEVRAKEILQNLGFVVSGRKISVPSWRQDVEGRADIVEEVLRVDGLKNIPLTPIKFGAPITNHPNIYRNALVARGMNEVVTYSFGSEAFYNKWHSSSGQKLLNPISEELSVMRDCLIPNLVEAAIRNNNRGFKNVAIFEIGPVFGEKEQIVAGGIRVGKDSERNIYNAVRGVDAFDAKADLLAITGEYGEVRAGAPGYYHPGRSGGIFLGKNCLGYFGELHPALVKMIDAPTPIVAFEAFIQNLPKSQKKYKKIEVSDFQPVSRDFAFAVNIDVKSSEIVATIRKVSLLVDKIDIFDIYQGDKIEKGKKSVALAVNIQPKDKTLTDAEIEAISANIIKEVTTRFQAELRK